VVKKMKRGTMVAALIVAGLVIVMLGCTGAQKGALIGGAVGAGSGALIGHHHHYGSGKGALVGAGIGALTGALVGDFVDNYDVDVHRKNQPPPPPPPPPAYYYDQPQY
jgi:hypothetical protein